VTQHNNAELMPASFREWTEVLARIRFGKVRAAGKNITGATIKAVAGRLATYADSNGTRVRPGVARVAVDLELDASTVKTAISHLRAIGLLDVVRPGGRRGATQYRLVLPTDLLDRDDLVVWSPSEQRAEIEKLANARRGFTHTPSSTPPDGPNGGGSQVPQAPANESGTQVPEAATNGVSRVPPAATKPSSAVPIAGATGSPKTSIMAATGVQTRVPPAPTTDQDLDTTTTDHPDEDLRTAVTGPRARDAETTSIPPTRPKRCPHGLGAGRRADGRPECALCRVAEDRPGTTHPPPQPAGHIAPVIDINTREAS